MTNFQHPLHCVQFIRQSTGLRDLLLASSGPKIYSYAADCGQRLATWPQNVDLSKNGQGPPEKKRKVSDSGEQPKNEDSKATSEGELGECPVSITWSNIPLLVATADGKHMVALTAEDKCIRVFAVAEDGSINQLSARNMPKRPSAIVLANNDCTILCGDKFGDVYSLPLIPGEEQSSLSSRSAQPKQTHPAATTLTVHSKKNLRALEQQKRQWNETGVNPTEEKSGPSFEHQVILGHVSLLTDLIYVSVPSGASKRTYVLTGDRDEHIRVSRGPPQAHVIENYCLGHTSFVSKLCVPEWAPEYLISGGGDSFLLVWNWLEGRVLQKVRLVEHVSEATEIAVRGIWAVSLAADSATSNAILVALEGSPQLKCYILDSGILKAQNNIQLSGNVLDITSLGSQGAIAVSVDGIRQAGSAQEWRANPASPQTLLESFRVKMESEIIEWEPVQELAEINAQGTSDITATEEKQRKELNESLYSMGNLRKRSQDDE